MLMGDDEVLGTVSFRLFHIIPILKAHTLNLIFMFRYLLVLSFGLLPFFSFAQRTESIHSDRPGFAADGLTVGKKVWQIQSGIGLSSLRGESLGEEYRLRRYPLDVQVRYGITNRIEVEVGTELLAYKMEVLNGDYSYSGEEVSHWTVGARWAIIQREGNRPNLSLHYQLRSHRYLSSYLEKTSKFTLIYSQSITSKLGVNVNMGFYAPTKFADGEFSFVVNMAYSITDQWSVFGETYGGAYYLFDDYGFNIGGAYALNENVQFDAFVGSHYLGFGNPSRLINLGASIRLGGR